MVRLTRPRGWRFWSLLSLSIIALVGVGVGAFVLQLRMSGNFHVVVDGAVYRSAQPTSAMLGKFSTEHGIKTVINLRGANANARWYKDEVAAARDLGMTHIDFKMSASRTLSQDQAAKLIALIDTAEKPVLIHCNAGADRTGLAAALYLAAISKAGEEAAEWQMSLRFGHLSLPMTGGWAMDVTFERLEPWLGYHDS